MSNEVIFADKWLATALAGLAGGRVYSYVAPQGAVFPYIVYSYQGGVDLTEVGGVRILNSGVYQVKAIGQGNSMVALGPTVDAIDNALHRASATGILACVREQPLAYVEVTNGVRYNHLGGLYRIQVQS